MAKAFKDIEYTRVHLESPDKHSFSGRDNAAFNNGSDHDDAPDDQEKLIDEHSKKTPSFLSFEYYQQFFDVDTSQVLRRLVGSMIPHPKINFLTQTLKPKPDLYGPFWVCTTLIFTIAITGNIANFLQFQGEHYRWKYDFKKVTFAATAIYSYWWIVPLFVWGILRWRKSNLGYGFIDILAVYGYSLAIYIPISIFWVIQINWLQWLLVMIAMAMSGTVLLLTFLPVFREGEKKSGLAILIIVLGLHAALALGFMLYFFHVPSSSSSPLLPTLSTSTIKPSTKTVSTTMKA